jgi:hypothetical protein
MVDKSSEQSAAGGAREDETAVTRASWSIPAVRRLVATDAQLGPNFTATDGIEGHS